MKPDNTDKKTPTRRNSLLKKQRVTSYFIEAAKEIACESGMESLNIRSVSERAGYYSASLYNYFENLEQLLAFTAIDLSNDYLNDVIDIWKSDMDSLDRLMVGWRKFAAHSFSYPSIFTYIYDPVNYASIASSYDAYYELFPHKCVDYNNKTVEMFFAPNLLEQDHFIISRCVRDGYFAKDDADRIISVLYLLHEGMMVQATRHGSRKSAEELTAEYMDHCVDYLHGKLKKKRDLSGYIHGFPALEERSSKSNSTNAAAT